MQTNTIVPNVTINGVSPVYCNGKKEKPHTFIKTVASTAAIGGSAYGVYKKVTSSPQLLQKAVNLFNRLPLPLFKGSSKNMISNHGKVGIMIGAVCAVLTALVANKNSYEKGKAEGRQDIGICFSTTA